MAAAQRRDRKRSCRFTAIAAAFLSIFQVSGPASARPPITAPHVYEIDICEAQFGDFDLELARTAAGAGLSRVGYDVYARDYAQHDYTDSQREYAKPILVTTIERVRHGRELALFLRFYRVSEMGEAMVDDARLVDNTEITEQLGKGLKASWEHQFPC